MDDMRTIDRRRLLRGAGVAATAGAGMALLGPEVASAAGLTPVTAYSVKDYGATGNGSTNDAPAIQAALDAAGVAGGAVYFPPGDYAVAAPLVPKSRTLLFGSHTPRWDGSANPASACKVRAIAGLASGQGLIQPAAATVAVTIRNLALVGNNIGTNVHGFRPADNSAGPAGNASWCLEDVTIAGFTGNGIHGRLHVANLINCFIHNNVGWGMHAAGGNNWNDVHVANCYLYYNRTGNLYFGGTQITAAIDFVNCRFERAGTNPANVLSPLNPSAPGLRIASARQISFTNCNTDANCGNGVEVIHEADTPGFLPNHIMFDNCRFMRDGTGDQATLGNTAGVKVVGTDLSAGAVGYASFVNCMVGYGKADDAGGGTIIGPRYGVWYQNSLFFQWLGGDVKGSTSVSNNAWYRGGGAISVNYRPAIIDLEHGLMTVPLDQPTTSPIPHGAIYFDQGLGVLRVRNTSDVWVNA
jgi:polygalacturonase